MKNPTKEQLQRRLLGAQALRNNPKKARGQMASRLSGGRCCLCVLLDCAVENGYTGPTYDQSNIIGKYDESTTDLRHNTGYPHREAMAWYGWDSINPRIHVPGHVNFSDSSTNRPMGSLNDHIGPNGEDSFPHAKLADMLEADTRQQATRYGIELD